MNSKILFLAMFVCITSFVQAQNEPVKDITSEINSVVVYLQGAQISHIEKVQLPAGRNKIVFHNLSSRLDARSVRVTTDTDVSVLSISTRADYLTRQTDKPRIKQLKDSVIMLERKVTDFSNELDVYEQERDLIMRNKALGGTNTGVSIADLQKAADFYRLRLLDINNRSSELNRKITEQNEKIALLNNELAELNSKSDYIRSEVTILVSTTAAKTVPIDLKYLVSDCGWTPTYDIRATDIDQPIDLEYRAKVYNNTDIDWKNVKLRLSTGDPTLTAASPTLSAWYLTYSTYDYSYNYDKSGMVQQETLAFDGYTQNQSVGSLPSQPNIITSTPSGTFQEVEISELSAEFDIAAPYTIPSDNKPYLVDVTNHRLPATYKHYAVPKIDCDAFLIAQITGWQDLNLVEGPANVYFAGSYVGESYISTRNVKDTLPLSLGRDGKVLVTRTKLTNFSSTRFIGTKRRETMAYEIVIRNNRKTAIDIELLDQLPVSQNSEIEVEVEQISGAQHDLNTGKLTWKYNIQPAQTQKINLTFSIKYPKQQSINLQQTKKRSMRMY